ncbi:hypothetical protein DVH05_006729 [Phytophthora capsici]|nr:hypothetical protein DVH05_006729 [Phytophthora capsici]
MTFKACWKELKRDGWTSKPPVGLSNDFFYIKPGKTKKGLRGEDFFIGEKELMAYLDRLALDQMRQEQKSRDGYVQTIATQNMPNHGEDTSREHIAVPYEAGIEAGTNSPEATPDHTTLSESLIPTSPHIMASDEDSERSSQNTTALPDDTEVQRNLVADFEGVVYSGNSGDGEPRCGVQADQTTAPGPRPQCNDEDTKETESPDTLRDPNINNPGEALDEYAALDSDGGCEGDSVYDDDADLDWGTPDPGCEEENTPSADIHFTPDLLATVDGFDAVARGDVPATALDAIRDYGWTEPQLYTPYPYMDCPYEMRPDEWIREDYPGIYEGDQGPTAEALNAASTVLGAFLRFVTPQLLERIGEETNTYFYENLDARVETQYVKQQARKKKKTKLQNSNPARNQGDATGNTGCIGQRVVHFCWVAHCKDHRSQ